MNQWRHDYVSEWMNEWMNEMNEWTIILTAMSAVPVLWRWDG